MLVLPADQTSSGEDALPRGPAAWRPSQLATGAFGIDDPLVTLGVQVDAPGDRVRLPASRDCRARRADRRARRLPAPGVRGEAERRPGPTELHARDGGRLERGDVPLAPAGDPERARAVHRPRPALGPMVAVADPCSSTPTNRSRSPMSIDYAVMESAARDGQVVMASMDVGWSDLGSWTALLAAIGAARDRGGRAGRARPSTVEADDLVDPAHGRAARGRRAARAAVA